MWKLRSLVHSTLIQEIIILVLFTALYGIHVVHLAVTQPIWLDEWFTVCVATMPTLSGLFDLIWSGYDIQPPLFYLLTRGIISIFGESNLTLRLPAIFGFWVCCVSVYLFIRLVGGGVIAGAVAMIFPCITTYFTEHAYEARPYGIVLGCAGLSLVFRQLTINAHYRWYGFWGLGCSFSIATCMHYFAIFYIATFFLVEVVLSIFIEKNRDIKSLFYRMFIYSFPLAFLLLHFPIVYHKSQAPY